MRLRGSQETSNSYWDTEVRVGSFGTVGNPIVNGPDARGSLRGFPIYDKGRRRMRW